MRHRRRSRLEGKRAVGIDRDRDGNRRALLKLLGLGVERLAELHDGEAALAERRTDRRRRIGRAGRHLQFDIAGDFLCHSLLLLVVRISTVGGRLTFHVVHTLLLLPACGEKAGMRGLTAGVRLAATTLTSLRSTSRRTAG